MIRAVLIDDEYLALDLLEILLREIGGVDVVGKFLNAAEALHKVPELNVDLVFLDIEMPGMNGIAAAKKIRLFEPELKIVFVSAYQQYALDAFDVEALDYLLKPLSKDRVTTSLQRYKKLRMKDELAAAVAHTERAEAPGEADRLKLRVLGSLELFDKEERLLSWRTKKAKELFVYLWQAGGAPVHRFRILEDLWPDTEANRAQTLLHTSMYYLRSMLRKQGFPDAISFTDERYAMRTEFVTSDAEQLRAYMQAFEPGLVGRLLELYRGDYLEEEDYGWAAAIRSELRQDYLRMIEQAAAKSGEAEREAIWRKLIRLEPYSEDYYEKLLTDMAQSGNAAHLRSVYGEIAERFAELGVQPSQRILSLMKDGM